VSVSAAIRRDLAGLRVLTDAEELVPYSRDESYAPAQTPLAVVEAFGAEDVQRAVNWAVRQGIRVTPRGAGSGQSGGAVPEEDGLVISLMGMNAIRAVDADNLVGVVEPGVVTGRYQEEVEARGLFYPPDPGSLAYCSMGGNVAENAGGPRALKYGVTADFILGLEVVLMSGERIRPGRATVKGVAGYDVTRLLVGSEGTLGIITEITTSLLPLPRHILTALAFFGSTDAAAKAVSQIIALGIVPRVLEYIDAASVAAVRPRAEIPVPEEAAAALIIEVDGMQEDELLVEADRVMEACKKLGANDVLVAQTERQRRRLWSARRMLSPALKERYRFKIAEDAVVPRSRLPEMVAFFEALGREIGVDTAVFGHAGDGNLHLNFLFDDPGARDAVETGVRRVFEKAVALGGTITGEHGVGLTKRPFLPIEQAPGLLTLQKSLKKSFDPLGLLNPSKIFE
jgi:glycolate oxidase